MQRTRKVFIVSVFLLLFSLHAGVVQADQSSSTDGSSEAASNQPEMGQTKETDSIFKFEKKDRRSLLQFKGSGASRSHEEDDKGAFGLEALYGRLFNPTGKQFAGYYFFSGKVESDNRQRFNATLGYFLPGIGGEAKATYRLFNGEVRETLDLTGGMDLMLDQDFEESALEQGFGASYRKRFKIIIRELTLKYAYSHLTGESVDLGEVNLDDPTVWRRAKADAGFGDVDTHEAHVEVAVGSDEMLNPIIQGIRVDLGTGYQDVTYEGFRGAEDVSDTGAIAFVQLRACTPAGVFKGWYQDSEAATTYYTGYQLGGMDLYYKNIDYGYGEDEEVVGVGFTVDMFDPDSSLDTSCPRFFYSSDTGYMNVSQMAHLNWLAADEFIAKPKVKVVFEDIFTVNKSGLPSNVTIDEGEQGGQGSGESEDGVFQEDGPKLVVRTGCTQRRIRSVSPTSAASAFGISGNNVSITMANLPSNQNRISARVDDACCGDTVVTVRTVTGASLAVNSVVVEEEVGCQEEPEEEVTTTTVTPETPTTTTTTVPVSTPEEPATETETTTSTNPTTTPTTTQTTPTTTTPAPVCLAIGSICNQNNDTCCPGSSCQFAFNTGSTSIYVCQP